MESILLSRSDGGEWDGGEDEDTEDGDRRLEAGGTMEDGSEVNRDE